MARDFEHRDHPNWPLIGVFTAGGVGLLAIAYYVSSYWQSVLDNMGTALLLFALLVRAEPRLIRHLRQPPTLGEALTKFNGMVAPLSGDSSNMPSYIKDQVLTTVGRSGMHQEPPELSSARFTSLGGPMAIVWRVEWDERGLRHLVTAAGKEIPRSMGRHIGWDKGLAMHHECIYDILCYLLRQLTASTGG